MRQFLLYAVIRLGLWALLWWLLTVAGMGVMLAGVLAALIAMLISILFLDRLRDGAAMRWKDAHERRVERRGEVHDEDAEYEDGLFADDVEIETVEGAAGEGPTGLPSLEADPSDDADGASEGSEVEDAAQSEADAALSDDEGPDAVQR
jgi:hypothetical protein